jgi:hypothetical protein
MAPTRVAPSGRLVRHGYVIGQGRHLLRQLSAPSVADLGRWAGFRQLLGSGPKPSQGWGCAEVAVTPITLPVMVLAAPSAPGLQGLGLEAHDTSHVGWRSLTVQAFVVLGQRPTTL